MFKNNKNCGLKFYGNPIIHFTARYYSCEDIDKARHPYELKPQNKIFLYLDYKYAGVGTGSCGPYTFKHYRVYSKKFNFRIFIEPLK